eukprot:scaffold5514_cov166-Ochromonas_danica.AAC.15
MAEENKQKLHHAYTIELVLFACAIFLKGDVILWNNGVSAGYQSFQLCIMALAIGYIAMILCLSEMTSITAFAGGCYGYTRCSIGPYFGFICGCCELLSMHIFTVLSVDTITECISASYGTLSTWELIWAGMVYVLVTLVFLGRANHFWIAMEITAVFSLIIVLMYLIGMMIRDPDMFSVRLSEREDPHFVDGGKGWANHLYYASWFFIGIECITVTGKKIKNPSKILSRALPISVLLATAFAFWQFKYSIRTAVMLTVPPLVSSAIGLMYSIINSTHAMAQSGMLPAWLKPTIGQEEVPIVCVIACIVFQYGMFVAEFMPEEDILSMLFPIAILSACVSYFGVLTSFISFKTRFSGMGRLLSIPIWICFFGYAAFMTEFIVVMIYDPQRKVANGFFFSLLFVLSVYYYFVVRQTQFFSKEEQDKFFKAYILNANKKRSNRRGKKSSILNMISSAASILKLGAKTHEASSKQRSGLQSMGSHTNSTPAGLAGNNNKIAPLPSASSVVIGPLAGKTSQVQPVEELRSPSF